MKTLLCLFILVTQLCIIAGAQKTFLRIYNSSGNRVLSGFYGGATDSSVYVYKSKTESSVNVYRNKEKVEILISDIGKIRTRRSVSRNTAIGALVGAASLGILGTLAGEKPQAGSLSFSSKSLMGLGIFFGSLTGAAVGSALPGRRLRVVFNLNGSSAKWRELRSAAEKAQTLIKFE
ncbi:hypothetical protein EXU57_24330 [Segetibacter sp. 3557_3]|uniref:hypothetical protein n=1 Tax=Segetibacter sp. 3557_3 TaxID=2547429 RepID=UPI001058C3D5|nr:hypothetical protein [Segetibacter sp. 3557_3]TDH18180.1 hypothetical protein EXU57_24330 [Segetibacter sp. 3557_3]